MDTGGIKELEKILVNAQDEYYNGTPIMSDNEYGD